MMNKTNTHYTINLGGEAMRFLCEGEQTGFSRMSRFDVLVWLLERAATKCHKVTAYGMEVTLTRGQVLTSYSELADEWGWPRNNVRPFIEGLVNLDVLTCERRGKATILTLSIATDGRHEVRLIPREEQDWLRFLFGVLSFEEFCDLFDRVMSEEEERLGFMAGQKSDDATIGRRLQRLMSHFALLESERFHANETVGEALRRLFIDECHADLLQFFTLLSFGGMKNMGGFAEEARTPISISDEASRLLAIVIGHYAPLMQKGSDPPAAAE